MDGFTVTPKEDSPFFVPNYLLDTYPELVFYDGDEINEEGLAFLYSLSRVHLCKKKAIELLSYREHSCFELSNKLKQRLFSTKEIEATINLLKEKNFLNDRRFTEIFINSRLRKKPEGKSMILKRIHQKGISNNLFEEVYSENIDSEMEEQILNRAFEKQTKKYKDDKQKMINSLLRLGFTYSQIKRKINTNY